MKYIYSQRIAQNVDKTVLGRLHKDYVYMAAPLQIT